MGDVITLDGLDTAEFAGTAECGKLVSVHSPVLGQSIRVCEVDAQRMAQVGAVAIGAAKRAPGRPKGKTVKNGARKPRVPKCKRTKIVKASNGRRICKCADSGNGQILKGSRCNLPKRK